MKRRKSLKLNRNAELKIIPTAPFHFDATFYKPAHFPTNDTRYKPGKRWQTMLYEGEKLGLVFENHGTAKNPLIRVGVFSKHQLSTEFLASLKQEIAWRFNLDLDLSHFYRETGDDPLLKPIIKKFYGLRPMHAGSLYEYLIIAIVLQNATVKRSVTMMQNLFENYGSLL